MSAPDKSANLSVQRKRSARLAAVQVLYKQAVTPDAHASERRVNDYLSHLGEQGDKARKEMLSGPPPQEKLLRAIVTGVEENHEMVEAAVDGMIRQSWTKDRVSPLLLAILRAAAFELLFHTELSPRIILNEYVSLTRGFFSDPELGFVNAALDGLARRVRPTPP